MSETSHQRRGLREIEDHGYIDLFPGEALGTNEVVLPWLSRTGGEFSADLHTIQTRLYSLNNDDNIFPD